MKKYKNKVKKYVLMYENYFISNDEVEGNLFVSDIEDAFIFSEKYLKEQRMDVCFRIGDSVWTDDLKNEIILTSVPVVVEV